MRIAAAAGPLDAVVSVPGSKSDANRVLVVAALAPGRSELTGLPTGDDTTAMIGALTALGADVEVRPAADGSVDVAVVGFPARRPEGPGRPIDAELAGTTSRFVTALAALGTVPITVDGAAPLRRRPMGPLHDALRSLGVGVTGPDLGHLPVTVTGPPSGATVALAGDVSSQFVSALMMIGPCLPDGLTIELTTPLASRPYVEMTARVMAQFGATVEIYPGERPAIRVGPGGYRPAPVAIPADASSASYPLAAAAVRGGRVTVTGLAGSAHPDAAILELATEMGCAVAVDGRDVTLTSDGLLRGIDVDLADCSDLVPTIAVMACAAASPTRLRGVGFVRGKESDRLGDLAAELRQLGADVEATDDGLVVRPAPLHGGRLATHHDHRLAMAFATLGTLVPGIEIDDPSVVSKSWPTFWDDRAAWIGVPT